MIRCFRERANISLAQVLSPRCGPPESLGARDGADARLRHGGLRDAGRRRPRRPDRKARDDFAARRRSGHRMARADDHIDHDRAGGSGVLAPPRRPTFLRQSSRHDADESRGRHFRLPPQSRRVADHPRTGGARRRKQPGRRQYLRGDGGIDPAGPSGDPPPQARAARGAHRRHRLRRADRAAKTSPQCRKSLMSWAMPKRPAPFSGSSFARKDQCRARRARPRGATMRRRRFLRRSRAIPAPSSRCKTAATTSCTFCVIPAGRGADRARLTPDDVAGPGAQIRRDRPQGNRADRRRSRPPGAQDLPGAPKLGGLVRLCCANLPDLPRLRLSSIDCIEADPDLLAAFAEEESASRPICISRCNRATI